MSPFQGSLAFWIDLSIIIGVILDNKKSRRDDIIIAIANSERENPEGMALL